MPKMASALSLSFMCASASRPHDGAAANLGSLGSQATAKLSLRWRSKQEPSVVSQQKAP